MSYLVVDVESTIKNKGHPFTPSNKLCVVGLKGENGDAISKIEYDDAPFGDQLDLIRRAIKRASVLVGFNIKFDLHWLRRYGIDLSGVRVHDCQLAYFIQQNQSKSYPSLNEVSEFHGFGQKLDVIEKDYWSKGIDTTLVPYELLVEYLRRDLELTEKIYLSQLKWLDENPKQKRLFSLQCQDLLVLEEMEWNGLLYDKAESLKRSAELSAECDGIIRTLNEIVGSDVVNWNSVDHVSSVLYGGTIEEEYREPFLFHYKDAKKEPVWKTRVAIRTHAFPKLCEPLPNTQLAKEGKWSASSSVLKELHTGKGQAGKIITLLLKLSELSKLNDYLKGLPKLMDEMEWTDGVIHGNLNQCITITGRLSANKPNQQNMPEPVQELIRSRYD